MATFQFSEHQAVELDFCGELKFSLPMDDDTQDKLKKASKYLQDKSEGSDIQSLSELCDCVMDAIDDVLGEGAADQIAALKPDFGFWDALDVVQYISREYNAAKGRLVERFQNQRPQAVPSNRAQRRAAAKAKLTAVHKA